MTTKTGPPYGGPARKRPIMMASMLSGLQAALDLPADDWRARLAGVGLTPEQLEDADMPLPLEKGFAAFEAAGACAGRPAVGIEYALKFAVGATGATGFAVANAGTVRVALQTISRFIPLVASLQFSRYEEDDEAGSIAWRFVGVPIAPRVQSTLWSNAVMIERVRVVLPPDWKPLAVWFDFDRPRDGFAYEHHFGQGVRFGQPHNKLAFQAGLLDRPMQNANPRIFELMTRLAEIEQHRRGTDISDFESNARSAIAQMLGEGQTSITDLAAAMNVDISHLRQSMKDQNLDFRALVEDVRKERARNLLIESDVSITTIAFALGYSDSSIFTRACNKWFEMAPRDLRNAARRK